MISASVDRIIKNVRIVRPGRPDPEAGDIAIQNGKIESVAPHLDVSRARDVVDGAGLLAFPGIVDAHMHVGIYTPLADDAGPESRAAAAGGVTTSLNYMRTGQYYLNRGGPYREFLPEVLRQSKDRFYVDYAYHLAPISREHIGEMEMLVREHGVTSFKIFMFYGSHGLHGRSAHQNDFLMLGEGERYDLAHFEFIMRELSRINAADPSVGQHVSLSLHCELGEILTAYTKLVEDEGKLTGLRAYSASRPAHSEGLAIWMASYLANETSFPNINLLHLSSKKAIEAALTMKAVFPHIEFRREVTIGHLLLDVDSPAGNLAKVNPPIRPREDVERLWQAVLAGDIDWICSDHACCSHEQKVDPKNPGNIFAAKSGFGGTEYLLSGVMTEGRRRGLSYGRMAELLCQNPARRYGLYEKGDIAAGFDADIVLVDPAKSYVVRASESPSKQGYTPFEGMELSFAVQTTFLRGEAVWDRGEIVGAPRGRYVRRPYGRPQDQRGREPVYGSAPARVNTVPS